MSFRNTCSPRHHSFILLAPAFGRNPHFPGNVTLSRNLHSRLLMEMQRLRGRVYLADGAIKKRDLDAWGRHVQRLDSKSWHLIALGSDGRVAGCTRFRRHSSPVSWAQLVVRQAPIAQSDKWGVKFRSSIDAELAAARRAGFSYVEVGGWALAEEVRGSFLALKTVLATYAWSQLQGGALGITTATERNESAGILRRLGGRPLACDGEELPPYYDHRYRCWMEVLRFDSREPNPKYGALLERIRHDLATAPVISAGSPIAERHKPLLRDAFALVKSVA
jgi:hypothetical protein